MTASKTLLSSLHTIVAEQLLDRISSGEATSADFGQAIKFLKDNGIEALPDHSDSLNNLTEALRDKLPFTDPKDPLVQ